MSAKKFLVIGSALFLSACASASMIDETGDIANQFCLSNANPHGESRKLLLSPAMTHAMKSAQMRHGIISAEPAPAITNTAAPVPAESDLMPTHSDSSVPMEPPAGDGENIHADYAPVSLCKPGRAFTINGVRYAEIHHAPASGGEGWTDRLVLKQVDGKWMIDNILFAPDYRRSMRETLIRAN